MDYNIIHGILAFLGRRHRKRNDQRLWKKKNSNISPSEYFRINFSISYNMDVPIREELERSFTKKDGEKSMNDFDM